MPEVELDVDFNVEPPGTVSYAGALDQLVPDDLGTSTVTLLSSSVTVVGPSLSGTVFFTSLDGPTSRKSVTHTISLGVYRVQRSPTTPSFFVRGARPEQACQSGASHATPRVEAARLRTR